MVNYQTTLYKWVSMTKLIRVIANGSLSSKNIVYIICNKIWICLNGHVIPLKFNFDAFNGVESNVTEFIGMEYKVLQAELSV